MRKLSMGLLLFLLALLVAGGPLAAQDVMGVTFCGDLATEDCDLLMASKEAMTGLQSTSLDFNMGLDIRGIPDMPFDKLIFQLNAKGAAAVAPEVMTTLQQAQENPMQFADPQAAMTMLSSLVSGVSGDFTLSLDLPPDLVAMAGPDANIPATLTLEMRMVDGVVYFNLDKIAAAIPDADIPPGWMGVDLSSLVSQLGAMSSSMGSSAAIDEDAMSAYMQSLMDPETLSQFMTIERVDDAEMMGQTMAVFRTTFDLSAFMQSDTYQNFLKAQMDAATAGQDVSPQDQAQIDEMMSTMTDAVQGLVIEQTVSIGVDDHYTHASTLHMAWDMSDLINTIEPGTDASGAMVTLDVTTNFSDFNNEVTVDVPDNATLIPLGSMMSGGGSF